MARDYGTRRTTRPRGNASQQLLVIIVTFLLGYLTATVFDVEKVRYWMNTQVLAHQNIKPEPTKPEQQHVQIPPKPKFEFYTLLANEKVGGAAQVNNNAAANNHAASNANNTTAVNSTASKVTSVATTTAVVVKSNTAQTQQKNSVKVAEGKPLSPSTANKGGSYLVQVASFKARKDAEQMKGMLTLKGYNVSVVAVSQAQGNWFRVVIGPYSNRQLAQKAQITIAKTERLNGMVKSVGG